MKAIAYSRFGPPTEVLQAVELPQPVPKAGQVLVRVRAAAMNPLDWHFIRGEPSAMRLMGKPSNRIPGVDLAGRIEAVGPKVASLRVGDEVFGIGEGTCAEFACAAERCLAHKPTELSYEEAAAIPTAACTALIALRDHGRLKAGQRVLVNGAAGGIGTFAVQIAKATGGDVTAVCSTRNLDLMRSIGADHAVDYTAEDFTLGAQRYDLILHVAGNRTVPELKRILTPHGTLVLVGRRVGREENGGSNADLLPLLAQVFKKPFLPSLRQKVIAFIGTVSRDDLRYLAQLAADGKLRPVIDRAYPLHETADALAVIESGHPRGKLVITAPHQNRRGRLAAQAPPAAKENSVN